MSRKNRTETRNFDADQPGIFPETNAASATEATGMMLRPPRSEGEARSESEIHTLQAEFPDDGYVRGERGMQEAMSEHGEDVQLPLRNTPIGYMSRLGMVDPVNRFVDTDDRPAFFRRSTEGRPGGERR